MRGVLLLALVMAPLSGACGRADDPSRSPSALRVCADPNNLPFSNARLEGFENRLAALLARDFGMRVEYTWWAQRRGFLRNTLNAGECDVVMGLPTRMEMAATTRPYYTSTYVFVTRRGSGLQPRGFDDRVLRTARIGVPLVGDDGASTPPAHALSRRGIIRNVVGYSVYGNYADDTPPARLIEAVADGAVDVALAWGPLAGYYASRQRVPLEVVPVNANGEDPRVPFSFDMSMAVRRRDTALRERLDAFIVQRRDEIDAILDAFHVPRVAEAGGATDEDHDEEKREEEEREGEEREEERNQ